MLVCRWTGSNTNPNNNDGQGRAGTDRSNIALLRAQNYPEGMPKTETFGHWGNNYPEKLDAFNTSFLGLSREDRQSLATLGTRKQTYCVVNLTVYAYIVQYSNTYLFVTHRHACVIDYDRSFYF